jgi:hypothetical protein
MAPSHKRSFEQFPTNQKKNKVETIGFLPGLWYFESTFDWCELSYTVKLGNKERFDKEQIGIKNFVMDYQPFYTINLLLDKELLPI